MTSRTSLITLYRRAFYFRADLQSLLERVRTLTRGAKVPTLAGIFLQVHFGAMSDRWREF